VCVGLLCVGEADFVYRSRVIKGLTESAAAKQFELHCTIGDALVCAAQGSRSPAARDIWTVTEADYATSVSIEATDDVAMLLGLLLEQYLKSQNPHVRQVCLDLLLSEI